MTAEPDRKLFATDALAALLFKQTQEAAKELSDARRDGERLWRKRLADELADLEGARNTYLRKLAERTYNHAAGHPHWALLKRAINSKDHDTIKNLITGMDFTPEKAAFVGPQFSWPEGLDPMSEKTVPARILWLEWNGERAEGDYSVRITPWMNTWEIESNWEGDDPVAVLMNKANDNDPKYDTWKATTAAITAAIKGKKS